MQYNTSQEKLVMPEYGRNVYQMVQHALQIEDREQRNNAAYTIIGVMGALVPHLRDVPDFKHKLWNHLLIISDFKLDIDAPYPPPPIKEREEKPYLVPYTQSPIRQKHYGKILLEMIRNAGNLEDSQQKADLISLLVTQLRKSFNTWSRGELNSEQIIQDILDISEGKILLKPEMIPVVEPSKENTPSYSHSHSPGHTFNPKRKRKFPGIHKK